MRFTISFVVVLVGTFFTLAVGENSVDKSNEEENSNSNDVDECNCTPFNKCKSFVATTDGGNLINIRVNMAPPCQSYMDVCCNDKNMVHEEPNVKHGEKDETSCKCSDKTEKPISDKYNEKHKEESDSDKIHEEKKKVHDTEKHNTEKHDSEKHNTEKHDTEKHNTEKHNTEKHNTDKHDTEKHDTDKHDTEKHDTEKHNTEKHDTEKHDTEKHNTEEHDTEKHDTDKHNTEKHDTEKHDTEKHDTEKHDTEKHDNEKHDTEKHDTEKHNTENHDTEKHHTDKHDTEKHNTEKHDTENHETEKQNNEKHDAEKHDTEKYDKIEKSKDHDNSKETDENDESHHKEHKCGNWNKNGVGFRIINADDGESQYGEYPSMVAIFLENSKKDEKDENHLLFHCGGSLIKENVILTAAHCVIKENKSAIIVRAGDWDLKTEKEIYAHQDRRVSKIITHPGYYSGGLHNDVALIFTEEPFYLQENVQTICLPKEDEVFNDNRCFSSGWGHTVSYNNYTIVKKIKSGKSHEIGKYQVNILKKVEVPVVPRDKCEQKLRRTRLGPKFILHDSFMCAGGEEGKDTCRGDGGGPLMCPSKHDSTSLVQTGIVAWGIQCGLADIPAAYVDVARFRKWIDEETMMHKSNSKKLITE